MMDHDVMLMRRLISKNYEWNITFMNEEASVEDKELNPLLLHPEEFAREIENMNMKEQDPKHKVGYLWKLHFFIGFLTLCFSIVCNGGRKYIAVDHRKYESAQCDKLFVNVYSTSADEEGALICCRDDSTNSFSEIMTYEGFLCNKKLKSMPLAKALTRYPDSWLLPLIPLALRMVIILFGKLLNKPHPHPHDLWTSTRRLLFLCSIFMVRGWGLYVFLNMVEDIVISSNILSSSTSEALIETTDLDSCWFSPLLKSWQRKVSEEGDKCYGVEFDFSDHVVLFFSHSYPSMIFEAMFCFLVPFIPKERKHLNTSPYIKQPGRLHRALECFLETVLPVGLLLMFLYLNMLTLLAVHSTVAYYHSIGEVVVGYIISLSIQIPVGFIIYADGKWKHIRSMVGYPKDRDHHLD